MNDEQIIELYSQNADEAISATSDKYGSHCYNIAYNILINNDTAAECVNKTWLATKGAIPPARPANLEIYLLKITRHIAFDKYMSLMAEKVDDNYTLNNEMNIILNELKECSSIANNDENVVSLQLSNVIEIFANSMPKTQCEIFLRRYFYADSIANIATLYKKSENNILSILKSTRKSLAETFAKKGYYFNATTLFISFADLSEELISGQTHTNITRDKKSLNPVLIITSALLALCVCAIIIFTFLSAPKEITDPKAIEVYQIIDNGYINTSKLLEHIDTETMNIGVLQNITSESHSYWYSQCSFDTDTILKYCVGDKIESFGGSQIDGISYGYYKLLGHDDLYYIIEKIDSEYFLWKFSYIDLYGDEPLSYKYLLSDIYGIESADDIAELAVVIADDVSPLIPYYINDSDAYTNIIDKRSTVECVYDILSSMEYYGANNWEMINSVSALQSGASKIAYNLKIKTKNGDIIDSLYFNNYFRGFYESNDVACSELDFNTLDILRDIRYGDSISTVNPEYWDVKVTAHDITSTCLTLHFEQCGTILSEGLWTDPFYYIEKWDGVNWNELTRQDSMFLDYQSIDVPQTGYSELAINWEKEYGELTSGKYRIATTVYDLFTSDYLNEVVYFAEFCIE